MSKGFASDTGSSHRWLAGLLGRSVGSLPSAGVTRLRRYYEPVRPCASHRYSAPQQPVDEVQNWPSTHNMSRPKLRMTTLCSGLIAEQRLRQRAVRGLPLGGLPWHRGDRFPRSAQEPLAGFTPSSCRSPLGQSAGFRRALSQANNGSLVLATSLRFRHLSNGSLTFV